MFGKSLVLVSMLAASTIFGTDEWRILDDFEQNRIFGWSAWAGENSTAPIFSLTGDTPNGKHALKIEFPNSSGMAIAGKNGVFIPRNEDCLTLVMKVLEGGVPDTLLFEEEQKDDGSGDVFRFHFAAQATGEFQKISIPFKELQYAYTKGEKGNKTFDKTRMFSLNFTCSKKPGKVVIIIDELVWSMAR